MPTIIEPVFPVDYEKEWRYQFEAANPKGPHVVVSGRAQTELVNGTTDDEYELYEVRLQVGPYWGNVQSVVPSVTLVKYENTDSDEDDEQGWSMRDLMWDTIQAPNVDEERIRLKFNVAVKGENSKILGFAYYVFARGRALGQGGLNSPNNFWPNPSP